MVGDGLAGVVLAGGKSRRLGQDKARIEISGKTLLARSAGLLTRFCRPICVSGRDPAEFGLDLPWLPDDIAGIGPMGGIATALERLGSPCLVISCDLPLLDEATLARLVEARVRRAADVVMTTFHQAETGYIESLVAIYEPAALPFLRQAAGDGLNKLSRAIPPGRRCHIPYTADEASVFFNINYPADLALLRRLETAAAHVPQAASGGSPR